MEHGKPTIHKRSQPYVTAGPSPFTRPFSGNDSSDGLQPVLLNHSTSLELDVLSSGLTSSLDTFYCSNQEQAPAKRRKLDTFRAMPQRHIFGSLIHHGDQPLPEEQCEKRTDGIQSTFTRWMEPVVPHPHSLVALPRRMAELMCGACGAQSESLDGYFLLPKTQSEFYYPDQPYAAEKAPVVSASSPCIHDNFTFLDWSQSVLLPFEDAGPSSQNTVTQFTYSEPALAEQSFGLGEFAVIQDQQTSAVFSDAFMNEESDALTSSPLPTNPMPSGDFYPIEFRHDGLCTSVSPWNPHLNYSTESTHFAAPLLPCYSPTENEVRQPWQPGIIQPTQSSFDILLPNQRGGKRGPFKDPSLREQTAQTRKIGSCIRCRMQRIRCEHNPNEPGGPCLTCKKVSNTKAGRFPCLRYKITDIKLYKPGQVPGYEWTRRWNNNISDPIQKWSSPEVKVIRVSAGYSSTCVELRVRKFVPQEGDKLERTWDYEGRKRSATIPPYALMDLEDGKAAYMKHIEDSMGDTIRHVVVRSNGLVRSTYEEAHRMYLDPETPADWKQLFDLTFRLWVAIRLSTTSEFIVGQERLGMPDNILDSTNPHSGKIPVPPVLGAQLDLVLIHHIQSRLRREMLDKLQKLVLKNKQSTWFVTYLVIFMLLHNASLIIAHDAQYAKKHGMRRRFAREDKVKEYYLGASILLAHFHYCNKGWYPFSDNCRDQDLRTLADLSDKNIKFVHDTRNFAKEHKREWERIRNQGSWENEYFFVSQLFEENWQPRTGA